MATIVQVVTASVTAASTQTTFVPNTAVSSELIAIVAINETTSANNLSGVVDSAGNTWSRITTVQTSAGASAGDVTLDVWHTSGAPSISSFTIISASSMATASIAFVELSGISGTAAVDAFSSVTELAAATVTPSVTPNLPNDAFLYIAASALSQLLDANTASIETSAAGWTSQLSTVLAQSTSHPFDGTHSLQLTSSALGDVRAITTATYPVVEGGQYTFSFQAYTTQINRAANAKFQWINSSGATVGSFVEGPATYTTQNAYATVSITAVVPSGFSINGVKPVVELYGSVAGGEVYWTDAHQLSTTVLSHVNDGSDPVATAITNSPSIANNGGVQLLVSSVTLEPQTSTAHSTSYTQPGARKAAIALAFNIGSNTVITGSPPSGLNASWQLLFNSLTIGAGSVYGLDQVSGVREIPAMRSTDDPRAQDNGTWIAPDWLGGRTIGANVRVTGSTDAAFMQNLQTLETALLPVTGSTAEVPLYWQLPGGYQRRVWGRVRKRMTPIDHMYAIRGSLTAVEFFCSDPLLYEVFDTTTTLSPGSSVVSGRTYTRTFNFTYGASSNQNSVNLVNNGNIPTKPVFMFYGPSTSQTISNNTTGETTQFTTTLVAGDVLVVDCRAKTALKNGVSALGNRVPGTAWLSIVPGTNNISYAPGSGTGQCVITFRSAWI